MTKPGPGKFEGNESEEVSDFLYNLTLDVGADEFFGTVEEQGWFGLFRNVHLPWDPATTLRHYIVMEDSNGFFSYHEYPDLDAVNEAWSYAGHEFDYSAR